MNTPNPVEPTTPRTPIGCELSCTLHTNCKSFAQGYALGLTAGLREITSHSPSLFRVQDTD